MRKIRLLYLLPIAAMVFAGCEKKNKNKNNEPEQQQPSGDQGGDQGGEQGGEGGEQQQQAIDFVGLTLNDATVTFDGQPHTISVAGDLPEGAQVSYGDAGNSFTAVGDHEVTATVTCEGYNTLVLHGTLHIVAADFAGLTFADDSVAYDGQPHSISVTGELPEGAEVSYGEGGNSFTAVGEHEVTATVTCAGYNDLVLHATLTITAGTMTGITFEDASVPFDGQPHSIEPSIPAQYVGATVDYGENGNSFTGSGLHVVTATVSCEGYQDVEVSANLTIGAGPVATQELTVYDFEGKTDNDLADDFDLKFYNNGWVTPQAFKVAIEKNQVFGTGTNTMKMTMTHQGAAFKATANLQNKTYNKYSAFTIDTMMDSRAEDGTMKVQVQFWLKDLPLPDAYAGYRTTYATYTLSENAPSIWTHWEIPFDDASLSIASGAIPVSALSMMGMTAQDLTSYIDQVAILVTPNYKDGKNCYAYVDNLKLTLGTTRVEERHIYGGKYVNIVGEDTYEFALANDLQTGSFSLNGAEVSALTVEKTGKQIIAKDTPNAGAGLTVTCNINADGSLTVASVSGAAQATYAGLVDMTFTKHANVNIDFTGITPGGKLNDSHWYQEKWDQNWIQITEQMNVRGDASNPHCNMVTGYYMDYRYTYTYPEQMGLADKFSIDLGNDFSGAADIKLKIKLVNAKGGETFVVGSSDAYEVIPAGTAKFAHVENNNFGEVNVKSIVVTVKSTTGASQYLYFDNLKLSHSVPELTPPPEPVHSLADGEYYIWNSASDAYRLTIADSQTTGSLTKCGSETSYPLTVEVDENEVTFKDAITSGSGITVVAELTDDNLMTVSSVTGALASTFSASLLDKTVKHSASADLNFSDGTVDSTYTESHWKESKYQSSGWTDYATPADMRSKQDKNGNKVVNFHCGTGAKNFRYTPDLPFGPVNHVEVDLGNYWASSAGELRYKISILGNDGSTVQKYVAGDASNWATLAKDTSQGNLCTKVEFDFDLCIGYAIRITTSMASGEAYLYMDNLKVTYKAPTPVRTITDGKFYLWNAADDAFSVSISDSLTSAIVSKLGGASFSFDVSINDEEITLTDNGFSGTGLVIVGQILENEQIKVTSVTGSYASVFEASLLNKIFKKCADVDLDFADGTKDNTYTNAHWTEQHYGNSGWTDYATPTQMRSKVDKNSNKIVNFAASTTAYNYLYTPDLPIGPINHLEVDLGNYYQDNTIQYKIAILGSDGNVAKYVAGDASNFASIAFDNSEGNLCKTQSFNFDLVVGYKVRITVKTASGTGYLYMDNLKVNYKAA